MGGELAPINNLARKLKIVYNVNVIHAVEKCALLGIKCEKLHQGYMMAAPAVSTMKVLRFITLPSSLVVENDVVF